MSEKHESYLLEALRLANHAKGSCWPNPAVGAVLVKNNHIISRGYHTGAGKPHAEIEALAGAGKMASGSTMYVSLEPCCHLGRTPPCTDAIIQAGISQVYYGFKDPNPVVSGKGAQQLRDAGIVCEYISSDAICDFYHAYDGWTRTGKPYVCLKLALSLDGAVSAVAGRATAISGKDAYRYTHQQRQKYDAILSSVNTILSDDPQFNVRLSDVVGKNQQKSVFIIDTTLRIPETAQIWQTAEELILFHAEGVVQQNIDRVQQLGAKTIAVPRTQCGLNLSEVIAAIGQYGCHDVWLEVGATLSRQFITMNILDRMVFYITPCLLGANSLHLFEGAFDFRALSGDLSWQMIGSECMLIWSKYKKHSSAQRGELSLFEYKGVVSSENI